MDTKIVEEVLIEPIEKVLFHLGRGIAHAQMELDRNSLSTQIMIDNNEELKSAGIEATWYQIPEVEIDLRMSIHIIGEVEQSGKIRRKRINISPINASYKNEFNYDVSGSTTLKLKILPVPPPIHIKGE